MTLKDDILKFVEENPGIKTSDIINRVLESDTKGDFDFILEATIGALEELKSEGKITANQIALSSQQQTGEKK